MLIGTFFLKEKFVFFADEKYETSLKDPSQLRRIYFKNFDLEFVKPLTPNLNENHITTVDRKLSFDPIKVNGWLNALGKIVIQRKVSKEDFSNLEYTSLMAKFHSIGESVLFQFSNKALKYELGPKIPGSELFYLRLLKLSVDGKIVEGEEIIIARNEAPKELYDPKNPNPSIGYESFKRLFSVSRRLFLDLRVFTNISEIGFDFEKGIQKIEIDNLRNKTFSLDFFKMTSNPFPFKGVSQDEKKQLRFLDFLKNLQSDDILILDSEQPTNKISTIKIIGKKNINLELFRTFKERNGYFLKKDNKLYQINPRDASAFLGNVQSFWIKKPFGKILKGLSSFDFQLSQGKESASFSIPKSADFLVLKNNGEKVKNKMAFLRLFLIIFGPQEKNLNSFSLSYKPGEAVRVSEFRNTSFSERYPQFSTSFLEKQSFKLEALGKELHLLKLRDELLIVDMRNKVIFHYPEIFPKNEENPEDTISLMIKDYIE